MKFIKSISALALTFMLLRTDAFGQSERINWFFKSSGENSRPEILGGSGLPYEYGALYIGPEGDKTIYLTFDAGYGNENVERILDVLAAHDAKAAFFILPGIIKNSPDTVKRMADEGHLLCNHTTTHKDMSKLTDLEQFKDELEGLEKYCMDKLGLEMTKYFRPPEGAFSEKTLEYCKTLGYTPVFWSFAYADWDNSSQPDPEKAKAKILNSAHDGMVMLLHPTSKTNADILDSVLTILKERGYSFGTLDELAEKTNA